MNRSGHSRYKSHFSFVFHPVYCKLAHSSTHSFHSFNGLSVPWHCHPCSLRTSLPPFLPPSMKKKEIINWTFVWFDDALNLQHSHPTQVVNAPFEAVFKFGTGRAPKHIHFFISDFQILWFFILSIILVIGMGHKIWWLYKFTLVE